MDPKLIFLLGISAFIVAELATLGWLLTRNPDSNSNKAEGEPEAGSMIGERQPYLQFLSANSFGEVHGEFSISTHRNYSSEIEKLEENIDQNRDECKYEERVFPELPECSKANKYGFLSSEDDITIKPCLYLHIQNADKLNPVNDGDTGKQTESYSVLCRSLLFRSKNSTIPETGLPLAVFPPDALQKKAYPLRSDDMEYCNPIIAVQLDLEDLQHYARAEIECEIFVEESTTFDRRKAELKLDINLSYDDSADKLLQNVLVAIKENSKSLGALEGNQSFVAEMEALKEELANPNDTSHLDYSFAPTEQHLTALEKAIEEYLSGHNSTHIITPAESKREQDLKTDIVKLTNNFLENARSNNTQLRQTLYNMEQQIDEAVSNSSQEEQNVILKQVKDILQSLSRQKGDKDFEQALVRLANPLLITTDEFSKLETRDPKADDAIDRIRNLLKEFILKKIDKRLEALNNDAEDHKVRPSKRRKIKHIIEVVERLMRKSAETSNTTDDERQLLADYEELLSDMETERNAVLVEGSEEQNINEQKRELNRLLQLIIPRPNRGLESIDQTLEKTKEDLEAQVKLVTTKKKKRKIMQIITIIERLKKRDNSTELNETLADQLENTLKDIEKSFVMTDQQLNELIIKLDDLSYTAVFRNERADLEEISEVGTTICTTLNGYNCTIADEEEALALLNEIWKSDNKSVFDNEDFTEKVDELVELLQQRSDLEEDQETFLSRAEEDLEKARLKNKKKKIIKMVLELHKSNKTAYPIPPAFKEVLENISQEINETQSASPFLESKYNKIIELLAHLNESAGISELLVRVEEEENREVEKIIKDLVDFIGSALDGGIPLKHQSYDKKIGELLTEISSIRERVTNTSKGVIGNISNQLMNKEDTPLSMKDFVRNISDILRIEKNSDRPMAFKQFLEDIVKVKEESKQKEIQKDMNRFLKEIIGLDEQKKSDWKDALATAKVEIEKRDALSYVKQFIEKASFLLGISATELMIETNPTTEAIIIRVIKNKTLLQGQEFKDKLIQIISNSEPFVTNKNLSAQLVEEKYLVRELAQQEDFSESYTKVADILATELESVQEQQVVIESLLKQLNKLGNSTLNTSEKLTNITDEIERRILPELQQNNSDDSSKLFATQDELMNMIFSTYENKNDLEQLSKRLAEAKSILNRNSFKELASAVEELMKEISDEISVRESTEKLREEVGGDLGAGIQEFVTAGKAHLVITTSNREGLKSALLEVMNDINNSNASLTRDQKVKVLRSLLEELRIQQPNEIADSEMSFKYLNLRSGVPNILLKRLGNILENTTNEDTQLKSAIKELVDDLKEDNKNELLEMISSNAKPSDPKKGQGLSQNVFQRKLSEFEDAVAKDPDRGRKDGYQTFDDQRRNLRKDLEKLVRSEKLRITENFLKYPSDMSLLLPTFQTLNLLKIDNVTCEGITMSKKNVEHYKNILRNEGLGESHLFQFFDLLDSSQSGINVTSQLHDVAVDILHSINSYTSLLSEKDLLDLIKRAAACSSKKIVDSLVEDLAMIQRMFTSRVFSEEMARQKMLACHPKLSLYLLDNPTFSYLTEALQTSKLLETFSVKVRSTLSSLVNDSVPLPAQEILGRYLSIMSENETIQIEAERADQLRKILRTYQAAVISSTSLTQAKVDEILSKLELTESLIRLSVKLSIVADSVSKILADKSSTEAKKISSLKLLYQKIEEAQLVLHLKETQTVNERLKNYLLEFKEKLEDPNQSCDDIENALASEMTSVELHGFWSEATDSPSSDTSSQIILKNRTTDASAICRLLQKTCPDICKNLTMLLEIMNNEKIVTDISDEDGDASEETTSSLEDIENTNSTVTSSIEHLHDQSDDDIEGNTTSGQTSTSSTSITFTIPTHSTTLTTTSTSLAVEESQMTLQQMLDSTTIPSTILIKNSTALAAKESTQKREADIDTTWLLELNSILSSSNESMFTSSSSETVASTSMTTAPYTKVDTKHSAAGILALTTPIITLATTTTYVHGKTDEESTETGGALDYVSPVANESPIDYEEVTEGDALTVTEHKVNEITENAEADSDGFIKGGSHSDLTYHQQEEKRNIEHIESQIITGLESDHHTVVTNTTIKTEADTNSTVASLTEQLHDQSEDHIEGTTTSGQTSTSSTTITFTIPATTMTSSITVSPTPTTTSTTLTTHSTTLTATTTSLAVEESQTTLQQVLDSTTTSTIPTTPSTILITTSTALAAKESTQKQEVDTGATWLLELNGILSSTNESKFTSSSSETVTKHSAGKTEEESTENGGALGHVSQEANGSPDDYDVGTEVAAPTVPEHKDEIVEKTEVDSGGFTKGGSHSNLTYHQHEERRNIEHIESQIITKLDSNHHTVVTNTTKKFEAEEEGEATAEEEDEDEVETIIEYKIKKFDEHGWLIRDEPISKDEFDNIAKITDPSAGVDRSIITSETKETSEMQPSGEGHSNDDPFEQMRMKNKGQGNQGLHLGQVKGKQGTKH